MVLRKSNIYNGTLEPNLEPHLVKILFYPWFQTNMSTVTLFLLIRFHTEDKLKIKYTTSTSYSTISIKMYIVITGTIKE